MKALHLDAIERAKAQILVHLVTPFAGRTNGHFMMACGLQKGEHVWDGGTGLPHTRVLDRALQALRKEGKIRFVKTQWEIVK